IAAKGRKYLRQQNGEIGPVPVAHLDAGPAEIGLEIARRRRRARCALKNPNGAFHEPLLHALGVDLVAEHAAAELIARPLLKQLLLPEPAPNRTERMDHVLPPGCRALLDAREIVGAERMSA